MHAVVHIIPLVVLQVQAARETEQYREEQASISELHIQSMMQLPPQVQHEAEPTIRRDY